MKEFFLNLKQTSIKQNPLQNFIALKNHQTDNINRYYFIDERFLIPFISCFLGVVIEWSTQLSRELYEKLDWNYLFMLSV